MHLCPGKSVCVFCGSRPGNDPAYAAAARDLGAALRRRGLRLRLRRRRRRADGRGGARGGRRRRRRPSA